MSHLIIVPFVLPAVTATFLLIACRNNLARQRVVSVGSIAVLLALSVILVGHAADGPKAYLVGNWPAPFGIVMVLDRLSALMVLLTSIVALAAAVYASAGWDARGRHFHVLLQFQLVGVNGAFLTGDFFNLFVCFEVMLISSYGLMLHGGGAWRLKAGFQYVALNLVASALFLFAVGIIYSVTGTLNMADLQIKATGLAETEHALLRTGALLLFVVFAMKSAMVPLHWWLPSTYSAASAPSAAIFAILTKVGAYSIIRLHTVAFSNDVAGISTSLQAMLLPAAAITLAFGAVGALASRSILALAAYAVIGSMGTLMIAAAGLEPRQLSAALYYMIHSTLIGAALFLLMDVIAAGRGQTADRIAPSGPIPNPVGLGALFLVAAIAAVGMPPLSGFIGKLAIMDSIRTGGWAVAVWTTILLSSLLFLVAFARAGSTVFWRAAEASPANPPPGSVSAMPMAVIVVLLASTLALSLFGGSVMSSLEVTAEEILSPSSYIRAVLPAVASKGL